MSEGVQQSYATFRPSASGVIHEYCIAVFMGSDPGSPYLAPQHPTSTRRFEPPGGWALDRILDEMDNEAPKPARTQNHTSSCRSGPALPVCASLVQKGLFRKFKISRGGIVGLLGMCFCWLGVSCFCWLGVRCPEFRAPHVELVPPGFGPRRWSWCPESRCARAVPFLDMFR